MMKAGAALPAKHAAPKTVPRPTVLSDGLRATSTAHVAEAIAAKGYFAHPCALSDDGLARLRRELQGRSMGVNTNDVAPVYAHHGDRSQLYLTHAMAVSRAFVELATDPYLRAVAASVMGDALRLKCQRYYETFDACEVGWHTDHNNNDAHYTRIPGLIIILYLVDVLSADEGPFQLLAGSHRWTRTSVTSGYDTDKVASQHGEAITTFLGRAGTMIIYDTGSVHRGKPIRRRGFVRKSIFLQIDAQPDDGEKILVNTAFLPPCDPQIASYLGFGRRADYPTFPQTGIDTLTNWQLARLQLRLTKAAALRTTRYLARSLLPRRVYPRLTRIIGHRR